ncbi:hypothetical protein [Lacinutrix jangbogonensis]|nr:hypothetical protein [Lacinutrix jangbogonensis]
MLNLTPQTIAPLNPVNGTIYFDGTHLKLRVNGLWKTVQLL